MPISDDEQTDDTENEEETIEQTENGMQIIVRNLMGENFTFEVSPTNTISEFKAKIEEKGWSPISMLLFDGEELQRETRTLGDYKIQNGSTVFVVYRSHDTKNNWINPENEGKLEANKTIKIWFDWKDIEMD